MVVGAVNTFVGLGIIFIAKGVLGQSDVLSNVIGYSFGLLINFSLNRSWTFRHRGPVTISAIVFLSVQAVAYSFNLICVLGLIKLECNSYVAQTLGILPYATISYLGARNFAFTPEK